MFFFITGLHRKRRALEQTNASMAPSDARALLTDVAGDPERQAYNPNYDFLGSPSDSLTHVPRENLKLQKLVLTRTL